MRPRGPGPRAQGTRDIKPCFAAQVLSFEVDLAGLLDWYSAEGSLYQRQQLGGVRSGYKVRARRLQLEILSQLSCSGGDFGLRLRRISFLQGHFHYIYARARPSWLRINGLASQTFLPKRLGPSQWSQNTCRGLTCIDCEVFHSDSGQSCCWPSHR